MIGDSQSPLNFDLEGAPPQTWLSEATNREEEDDSDDDGDKYDNLFLFRYDDRYFIWSLTDAVRELLTRPSLTPRQICEIGHLIFALERLPRRSENVAINVLFDWHSDSGDGRFYELDLRHDQFELRSGGWIDEGMGSDTYSSTAISVGGGWRDGGDEEELSDWLDMFKGAILSDSYRLIIKTDMRKPLDWSALDADENEEPIWPRKRATQGSD